MLAPAKMVCHCLLVESKAGLVLVETGIGQHDMERRHGLGLGFSLLLRPVYDPFETAVSRVRMLGFDPNDVRHIVVTHLDLDHAGGLADFPWATVHVLADELRELQRPSKLQSRQRYVARQFAHRVRWQTYAPDGDTWNGFKAVRSLRGLKDDILLIPLTGHSAGSAGVVVNARQREILHCGDAYFDHRQLQAKAQCPPALAAFQRLVAHNEGERRANLQRLRQLRQSGEVKLQIVCAHDPVELEQVVQRA